MRQLWEEADDETLQEVGRLTLAAVQLEDTALALCRLVNPSSGDLPVGAAIADARRAALVQFRPSSIRDRLDSWLSEAAAALLDRNAILHSVPVTFEPWPGTTPVPETTGQWLTHIPRNRSRAIVHTKLSAKALLPVRRRLSAAQMGWTDLINPLAEVRRVDPSQEHSEHS